MPTTGLKFVLVPWGSNSFGDDLWLLENALAFGLETIFEQMEIPYADLYEQLGGDTRRTAVVSPFNDDELLSLASRAPTDTSALIDGLIRVDRSPIPGEVTDIEIAPRMLLLPSRTFELPDAFRLPSLGKSSDQPGWFEFDDQSQWHALVLLVAEAILAPFELQVPAYIGPESLRITTSWQSYLAFIKAKRGTRTTEEKIGYYRQACRVDPHFYWARFNSGQLHKQLQDYHSARREFLAAIEGADDDPTKLGDTYFELGLCSIFLGDTKTARNFWDQALAYAPNNPVILVNVAGTYEQEEDWANAIRLHQAALDINPRYYKALVSLARLKAQDGQIEAAIPLYEQALAIKPDDPLRHAILGGCYLSVGDDLRAKGYFEAASQLDPPERRSVKNDDDGAPPPPGDYARQELQKLADSERDRSKQQKGGWKWFGR